MVALAPETGGGFKIVRKAEWGESGVVLLGGHPPAVDHIGSTLHSEQKLVAGSSECPLGGTTPDSPHSALRTILKPPPVSGASATIPH